MMQPGVKQGLVLGALVGMFLTAFFYWYTGYAWWAVLIPITAVMGAAPQLIKPADDDE